jgi:hypothetical protein
MTLPPISSSTSTQRSPRVRGLFLALWSNLAQAAAVLALEPVSSDTRLGLQLPILLMSALLLLRMQQGFALPRIGHSLLVVGYLALNFAPSALTWRTGLSASVALILVAAAWLPDMSQWLGQQARWRTEQPADQHRRFARQGLLYGAAWVVVAGVSLALTDWFNAPESTEVLMFSGGFLSGWALMGRYLACLILQTPAHLRD